MEERHLLTFKELVELQNPLPKHMVLVGSSRNTKMMFHKSEKSRERFDPKYNRNDFEEYQKFHHNQFFVGTEYVFSFWYEGKTARFVGCYRCNLMVKDKFVDNDGRSHDRVQFPSMVRIPFLEEYVDRLFVEWTNPTANYGRFLEDGKYFIHSISPSKDYSIGSFPKNFFEIHVPYAKLRTLFEYPSDNIEWKHYLANRCGVYYIDDLADPEYGRYIGSAYGESGFWGRWKNYVSKTDGNKDFFGRDYEKFVFSILWETLPNTSLDKVVQVESEFKNSLGTRVRGLNNN